MVLCKVIVPCVFKISNKASGELEQDLYLSFHFFTLTDNHSNSLTNRPNIRAPNQGKSS